MTGAGGAGAKRRLAACLLAAAFALVAHGACGEDRVTWDQLRPDSQVSGQVLCVLSLEMMTQEIVAKCSKPRKPIDDAIDRAVLSLQNFILTHSSQHLAPDLFAGMRRGVAEGLKRTPAGYECGGPGFDQAFRGVSPESLDAAIKVLLATPPKVGELVPCL